MRFITWGLIWDINQIWFETLVIGMEVTLFVSEAELEEFPEEDTAESTGRQEQSSEAPQTKGTVKSLLFITTSPTPGLLEKIKRGKVAHLIGNTLEGGSEYRLQTCKAADSKQPVYCHNKRPKSLVIRKYTIKRKQLGCLHKR